MHYILQPRSSTQDMQAIFNTPTPPLNTNIASCIFVDAANQFGEYPQVIYIELTYTYRPL